ncbi:MAG: LolA-like protein [Actinomycetota bacterium]
MNARKSFAGSLVLLCAVLGACGKATTGASGTPEQIVLLASQKTTEAKSSKIAMNIDVNAAGQATSITGDGIFDYARKIGSLMFKVQGANIPASMSSGFSMMFIYPLVYMKIPAISQMTGSRVKPWLKMDVNAIAKQQGLSGLGALGNEDPSSNLAILRGASNVRTVGTEQVRGVDTTHYTMSVNLSEALKRLAPSQRKSVDSVFSKLGLSTFPMDVWIDNQGRVRRVTFAIDLSKASSATSGMMNFKMELFDFGTPVDVSAPPADQVTDFSQIQQLMSGSATSSSSSAHY